MTKEEILAVAGYPNTEDGIAAFYNEYNTPEKFFAKHGGSLSGAPHNGQPTADQFFSYGSHMNDKLNIPMSNPFYLADGGTYYGGPIRPYAYGGGMDYFDEGGPNELPRLSKRKRKAVDKAIQTSYNDMLEGVPNDQYDEINHSGARLSTDDIRKFMVNATGPSGAFNDPGTYARNINNLLGRDVVPFPVNQNRMIEENWNALLPRDEYMYYNNDQPAPSYRFMNYENLTPIQPFYEEMAYGGYMDMGGNTASPTNYGAFNVPMMYGGNEEYGGVIDPSNNQDYPIMNEGGMEQYASGGDTSSLIKIIIAAGKARKKALGGDTVTQGGNSDNYVENLKNSFQNIINNNVEKSKIQKSLEPLINMQKAYNKLTKAQVGIEQKEGESPEAYNRRIERELRDAQLLNSNVQEDNNYYPSNSKDYRFRMLDNSGRNYYDYNPNSYYKVNQQNMKKLNTLPEGYGLKSVEPSYGAGARLASNVVGLFGGKEKAAKTLGKFAPKKIKYNFGKVSDMQNTASSSTQPGTSTSSNMPDYLLPGMYSPINKPGRPTPQSILQSKQAGLPNYKDMDYQEYMDQTLNPAYPVYTPPVQDNYNVGYKDMSYDDGLNYMNNSQSLLPASQQNPVDYIQNQNELKPGTPEYDNRNSAEYNRTLFQNMISILPYISPFAYGGGLNAYQGGGNPGGNPVEMDEDISVTAKRKRDIDTQKIGMAIPRVMDLFSKGFEQSQINDLSKTSSAVNIKPVNEYEVSDKGDYEANLQRFRPNQYNYATFYGVSPAAKGIGTVKYGGNIYQDGGYTNETDPQQQLLQGVAQMLQQGAQPNEIAQQLNQMGIPQEQIMQIIQTVMQQLQGSQQMKEGGLVEDDNLDIFDVDQEYEITDEMKEELRRRGYEFEELD